MALHGSFCWNELMTPDVAASKAFYAAALGWTYTESPMPDGVYTLAFVPGDQKPVAGLFHWPEGEGGSRSWFAYIAVDDIDVAVEKTKAAGGKIARGPWPIPGVGKIAIIIDAAGACVGYLEAEPM
jgi:predicted enzyme related to lactoylglutathione lyase